MDTEERNNPQFWALRGIEATYWNDYIATRPAYDDTIFGPIYTYHAQHSQGWLSALDIGTGAGSAIGRLAEKFENVVGSDNDPISLGFAAQRHAALAGPGLSFTLSSGEDLLKHHKPESFDLITCAETFPLLDTQTALHNTLTLLRPGGTLAVWFYGPPFFTEPEYAASCQPILDALMDHNFRPVVSGGGEARRQSWKRTTDGKFSWLDYIPFERNQWTDVRRHKWNTGARLSFFTPDACDFPVEPTSSVGEHETVTRESNAGFWEVTWDVGMLTRFVKASFPKPRDMAGPDETMDGLFERLMNAMGGKDVKHRMSWPAVLILATKSDGLP